jgi:hypothetical protein
MNMLASAVRNARFEKKKKKRVTSLPFWFVGIITTNTD